MMTRARTLLFLLALCALAPVAQAAGATAPIRVFVSIPPQKFLAQRIGGEFVDARVMLEPGHAPETFDPTPRRMAEVADADLYFSIGVPFESAWLPKLREQNPRLRIVECCPQRGSGAGTDADATDPHIWVSPKRFLAAAHAISEALGERDPEHRDFYVSNYRYLSAELVMLNRDLRWLLGQRRIGEFIISHAALGPLARDFGLRQIALETGGREIGPEALAGVAAQARRLGIRRVFAVSQHSEVQARVLARELGAELVPIDPLAENYLDNMRAIGIQLAAATR